MNSKFIRNISAAAALAIALGFPVSISLSEASRAQDFDKAPQGQILKQLNLSSDQIQRMRAIRESKKDELQVTGQKLRQAQQELRNLMTGTASADLIRSKFNEVQALMQQRAKLGFEQMLSLREVLTPAQRTQFAQLMQQRQGERRQRLRDRFPRQ